MLWLRACCRCGGDLTDAGYGWEAYIACLQCGGTLTQEQESKLRTVSQQRTTRAA